MPPARGARRALWRSAIGAAGPPLALARVAVADLAATRALLEAGGVAFRQRGGALIVGAGEAMGAALAFEAGALG